MGRIAQQERVEAPRHEHVIAAIVAASKETGADAVLVQRGEGIRGNSPRVGRALVQARAYAALALRAVFEGFDQDEIVRQVGGRGQFMASVDMRMRRKALPWWDDQAFMRVIAAIEDVKPCK